MINPVRPFVVRQAALPIFATGFAIRQDAGWNGLEARAPGRAARVHQTGNLALKKLDTFIQRLIERLFFAPDRLLNPRLILSNFRKHVTKCARNDSDEIEEERLVKSQCATITDRTTENTTQNVTAPFVGRNYSVRDCEAQRADVIGNDTKRNVDLDLGSATVSVVYRSVSLRFLETNRDNSLGARDTRPTPCRQILRKGGSCFNFTDETSDAVIVPFAVTSSRKLAFVTDWRDCSLV